MESATPTELVLAPRDSGVLTAVARPAEEILLATDTANANATELVSATADGSTKSLRFLFVTAVRIISFLGFDFFGFSQFSLFSLNFRFFFSPVTPYD